MANQVILRQRLRAIHGASYNAYKDLHGSYTFSGFTLIIDQVQGDLFASPSHELLFTSSTACANQTDNFQ